VAERQRKRCRKWLCTKWRCRKWRCNEPTEVTRWWLEQRGGSDGGGAGCRERDERNELQREMESAGKKKKKKGFVI